MNVINAYEQSADRMQPQSPAPRPMATNVYTLRKSGSRPLSFSGRHLGHHNGYRVGTALWHELNLYQADDGRYIAEIRLYTKAEGGKDQFHVLVADSMEEALGFFEAYEAKLDVSADFELDDPSLAPGELLVQAATLKYRLADAENQYKAVLGVFLKNLIAA